MTRIYTQSDYNILQNKLARVEKRTGLYLADENVDFENVGSWDWDAMYRAACMAAGQRAEEAGYNINKLLGEIIY